MSAGTTGRAALWAQMSFECHRLQVYRLAMGCFLNRPYQQTDLPLTPRKDYEAILPSGVAATHFFGNFHQPGDHGHVLVFLAPQQPPGAFHQIFRMLLQRRHRHLLELLHQRGNLFSALAGFLELLQFLVHPIPCSLDQNLP